MPNCMMNSWLRVRLVITLNKGIWFKCDWQRSSTSAIALTTYKHLIKLRTRETTVERKHFLVSEFRYLTRKTVLEYGNRHVIRNVESLHR